MFVELKKKYKGVVYKRRTGMSLAAARAYLGGADYRRACERFPLADPALAEVSLEPRSMQIAAEIDAMRGRYEGLAPSMAITCDRVAWRSRAEYADELGELRVTFDAALRFAERCDAWRLVIGETESIMEIKSAGPFPLWLSEALGEARAYPVSFSKYGTAAQIARAGKHVRPLGEHGDVALFTGSVNGATSPCSPCIGSVDRAASPCSPCPCSRQQGSNPVLARFAM